MSVSRKRALEYAYKLLERPRSRMQVELRQDQHGIALRHRGRVLTRTYLTRSGLTAAVAMAEALAVKLPAEGRSVTTEVSSGILYRVLAISQLDFRQEAAYEVATRLIEEARSFDNIVGSIEA